MRESDEPLPRRKQHRLKDYDYSQTGAYFVTACLHNRACILGDIVDSAMVLSPAGIVVMQALVDIPKRFPAVTMDAIVVMPNHLHAILFLDEPLDASQTQGEDRGPSLEEIMRAFKSVAAIEANRVLPRPRRPFWQRGQHDHVIRDDRDFTRHREYIENNPMSWALDEENPDCKPPKRREDDTAS